jgi:O-antigen/teichoic acid export membrane protein
MVTGIARADIQRNVVLNFAGYGLPWAAALVAVPLLLAGLGPDRFGVVTLAWTLVTMVGVLDLGFGRAVTQAVAARIGREEIRQTGALVGTATATTATLGFLLAAALFFAATAVVYRALEVPDWLQAEAVASLRVLALAVPPVLVSNCLRGVLEARQQFGALAALRAGIGAALLLGPVVALQVSPTLLPIMWTFVAVRWLALVAFVALAGHATGGRWFFDKGELLTLARLGGWMTVSSILASLMIYADRFVIGGLLSMAAVAYYVAPFEVIYRLSVVPVAIMGVLFPAFSQLVAARSPELAEVYRRTLWTIGALLAPPVLVIVVYSRSLLSLWLGPEVARESAIVASILAAGILIHSLVQPSFQLLQAAGRPSVPALFQLIEAPIYVVYLVALTVCCGIAGTAAAWLIRVTISLIIQTWLAYRFVLSPFAAGRAES